MSTSTDEFVIPETSFNIFQTLVAHLREIEKCLQRADGLIQTANLNVILEQKFTGVT